MSSSRKRFSALMFAMFLSLGLMLPATWSEAAETKADINSATIVQLEAVKGVGHDTAQNILAHKKEHGKFTSMNDLEAVNGVGKVRLEALNEVFNVGASQKGKK